MRSPAFSSVAASCRQAYLGVVRPVIVLENAFKHAPKCIPDLIEFFYEGSRTEEALRDEDLRELHLFLTDAYPEEVVNDPDLIQCLADLSPAEETRADLTFVLKQMRQMFRSEDNKTRSAILEALLRRISRRDMYWLLLRLTRKANPFTRTHFIYALATHYGVPVNRVKAEAMLVGLRELDERLRSGETLGVPRVGDPLIVPLPKRRDIAEIGEALAAFGGHPFHEVIRGERLTMHIGKTSMCIYDVNGEKQEDVEGAMELAGFLPLGIYLIERVPQDDFPLAAVDVLWNEDGTHDMRMSDRRDFLPLFLPDTMIKEMVCVSTVQEFRDLSPKNAVVFLHHPRKAVDYTNPVTHVRKISDHADGAVLRLGNGRWSTDPVRGLVMKHWEVMALDGDSFYTVGLLEAEDLRIEKRLRDTCEETKPATGAVAEVKGTFYVDVHLIHADYDDRGLRISGTIRALLPQVSKSDCADVTELEWLAGGDE